MFQRVTGVALLMAGPGLFGYQRVICCATVKDGAPPTERGIITNVACDIIGTSSIC